MSQKRLIKVIGAKGSEWEELLRKEVDVGLAVMVRSGRAELEQDELNQKRRAESVVAVAGNAVLMQTMNPNWLVEQILRTGQFEDEDIKSAFDKDTYGDRELMSEAAMAIEEILEGKEPKVNRGANASFIQKILDYAMDTDLDDAVFFKLTKFAEAHVLIAAENMARKAQSMIAEQHMATVGSGRIGELPPPAGLEGGMPTPRVPHAPNIPQTRELAGSRMLKRRRIRMRARLRSPHTPEHSDETAIPHGHEMMRPGRET